MNDTTNNYRFDIWIDDMFLTNQEVAEQLSELIGGNVSKQNIYAWRKGVCNPSKWLRPHVQELTKGKVRAKLWGKK